MRSNRSSSVVSLLIQDLARCSDTGTPYIDEYPDAPASKALRQVAEKIQAFFEN